MAEVEVTIKWRLVQSDIQWKNGKGFLLGEFAQIDEGLDDFDYQYQQILSGKGYRIRFFYRSSSFWIE